MSDFEKPKQEHSLEDFFKGLSEADQTVLDNDIFNTNNLPLEVMEKITDQEAGRGIMGRMRQYLEWKAQGKPKAELKAEALEISELIERQLE